MRKQRAPFELLMEEVEAVGEEEEEAAAATAALVAAVSAATASITDIKFPWVSARRSDTRSMWCACHRSARLRERLGT